MGHLYHGELLVNQRGSHPSNPSKPSKRQVKVSKDGVIEAGDTNEAVDGHGRFWGLMTIQLLQFRTSCSQLFTQMLKHEWAELGKSTAITNM